jgi:hypothetical protein
MKLKYVGLKQDGETAFSHETKIERWFLGDAHDIADEKLARRMLGHPDVFALDESAAKAAPVKAPLKLDGHGVPTDVSIVPAAGDAPAGITLAPGAAIAPPAPANPLADLDDAGVRAFAKSKGITFNGIALTKGDKLRAKVSAALATQ